MNSVSSHEGRVSHVVCTRQEVKADVKQVTSGRVRGLYLFQGFEQLGPLVLHALPGLLLQFPQQRSD